MAIDLKDLNDSELELLASGDKSGWAKVAAQKYGVPEYLIDPIIKQESGGSQSAISPKGARGIMQLMPGTAHSLGVNSSDWAENIWGGMKYLGEQLNTFGTPELALAAYNAGPHRVKGGKVPDIKETKNYVKTITDNIDVTKLSDEELVALAGGERRYTESAGGITSCVGDSCGDALGKYLNTGPLKGTGLALPRGGIGPDSVASLGKTLGSPVYSKNNLSLENLTPGTVIHMTRKPGERNYRAGPTHIGIVDQDEQGNNVFRSFTPGKGWKADPVDRHFIDTLPAQIVATNISGAALDRRMGAVATSIDVSKLSDEELTQLASGKIPASNFSAAVQRMQPAAVSVDKSVRVDPDIAGMSDEELTKLAAGQKSEYGVMDAIGDVFGDAYKYVKSALSPGVSKDLQKAKVEFLKSNPDADETSVNAAHSKLEDIDSASQMSLREAFSKNIRDFVNGIIAPIQGANKAVSAAMPPWVETLNKETKPALAAINKVTGEIFPPPPFGVIAHEADRVLKDKFQGVTEKVDSFLNPKDEKMYAGEGLVRAPGRVLGTLVPYVGAGKVAQAVGIPVATFFQKLLFNTATFMPVDLATGYNEVGIDGVYKAFWHSPITAALFTIGGLPSGKVTGTVGVGLAGAGSAAAGGERDPAKLAEAFGTMAILHNILGTKPERAQTEVKDFIKENNVTDAEVRALQDKLNDIRKQYEADKATPAQRAPEPTPEEVQAQVDKLKQEYVAGEEAVLVTPGDLSPEVVDTLRKGQPLSPTQDMILQDKIKAALIGQRTAPESAAWEQHGFSPEAPGLLTPRTMASGATEEGVTAAQEKEQTKTVETADEGVTPMYSGGPDTSELLRKLAPIWYSRARNFIGEKLPNVGTGQGLANTIQNWISKGVMPGKEEVKWTGVVPWLQERKGKVTRQEVVDFLEQNGAELRVVERGGGLVMTHEDNVRLDYLAYNRANYGYLSTRLETEYQQLLDKAASVEGRPKFQSYMNLPPGATNYREFFGVWPSAGESPNSIFRVPSGHQTGDPTADINRVFHAFTFDQVINRKKYLTIAELQSDWAHEGRTKGYAAELPTAAEKARFQQLTELLQKNPNSVHFDTWNAERSEYLAKVEKASGVPPFPFQKNWMEVAMKKMLRQAAEEGYDGVAWVSGDTVKERYDLSKVYDNVSSEKTPEGYKVTAKRLDTGDEVDVGVFKDAKGMKDAGIAADMAERLVAKDSVRLTGVDLKLGGEWANKQYDSISPTTGEKVFGMPVFMDKYGKQWGAKVREGSISSIQETSPGVFQVVGTMDSTTSGMFPVRSLAEEFLSANPEKVHTLDITPSMKETVLSQGQYMFSGGPDMSEWFKSLFRTGNASKVLKDMTPAQLKVASRISVGDHEKKTWTTPTDYYTAIMDQVHPFKKYMEQYSKTPPKITDDPYKQGTLFSGWTGKAEAFIQYHPWDRGTFQFKTDVKGLADIYKSVEAAGRTEAFRIYITARRSVERNLKGLETGIDFDAAQQSVRELVNEQEGNAKDYDRYNRSLLEYTRDSDLISGERFDQIINGSVDYAPLLRVMDLESKTNGGKGFQSSQVIKQFVGSERMNIDTLESTIRLTYVLVNAAERNNVAATLIRWSKESGAFGNSVHEINAEAIPIDVKLSEVIRDKGVQQFLKNSGLTEKDMIIFRPSAFQPSPSTISVWENGERKFYKVPKEIADIVKGINEVSVDVLTRLLSIPAQTLRLGATMMNPEFWGKNPLKDQGTAFIHSKYGYVPFVDLFRGVAEIARGGEQYWKFMISGAPHGELVSMDRRLLQNKMRDVLSGNLKMPGTWVRHPIEALKLLAEYGERGTRVGEFTKGMALQNDLKALESGELSQAEFLGKHPVEGLKLLAEGAGLGKFIKSTPIEEGHPEAVQEAGYQAQDFTVNFSRKGGAALAKFFNLTTAFWNPGLQGVNKFIRAHKERPLVTMAKSIVAVTIPSMLLEAAFGDDPMIADLPLWRKDLFFNIPTRYGPLSLPKPWTYGLLYGAIPQRIMRSILKDDPHAYDNLLEAVGREIPDFPIATAVVPFLEVENNQKRFTGSQLIPDWKKDLPAKFQFGSYTPETMKAIGDMVSNIPVLGDTKLASPVALNHIWESWTGGIGRMFTDGLDYSLRKSGILTVVPPPTARLSDTPVVRAFFARYPSLDAEPLQRFRDRTVKSAAKMRFLTSQVMDMAMEGQQHKLLPLINELGPDTAMNLGKMTTAFNEMSKFAHLIERSKDMPPDQKRETIDKIYLAMIAAAKQTNTLVDKVLEQSKGSKIVKPEAKINRGGSIFDK